MLKVMQMINKAMKLTMMDDDDHKDENDVHDGDDDGFYNYADNVNDD